jgi:hypothetical protein
MVAFAGTAGIAGVASCAEGVALDGADAGGSNQPASDAGTDEGTGPTGSDGSVTTPDAPPMTTGSKLILTEVVLAPSTSEFIEIANPTGAAVNLSNYYLSDSGAYFRTPTGTASVDSTDFIVKFPAGASIPANGVITVALDTAGAFTTAYGVAPTFALPTMTPVASSGVPSLTNGGEIVVLFSWDGASDTVRDVDIMLAGAATVGNAFVDKSGIAVDGPDADMVGTAYKPDARTLSPQATSPAAGKSTKRTAKETGFQSGSTGNGVTGADETSENTAMTWDTAYSVPTPGTVPTGVM